MARSRSRLPIWRGLSLACALSAGVAANTRATPPAGFTDQPLVFEANAGQAGPAVRYLARGQGYSLLLTPAGPSLSLRRAGGASLVRTLFRGGAHRPRLDAGDPLPGRSHYLLGNDPARWRRGVAQFGRVAYRDIYEGVDLVFYGRAGRIEYDFLVAAGARPEAIRLAFEGARDVRLSPAGDLLLDTEAGELVQHAPLAYQEVGGRRVRREARFDLGGRGEVGFVVGEYDRSRPLVIDPVLSFSTYLGGNGDDSGRGIAVDARGDVYVTGQTASTDFPTAAALQPGKAGQEDVFVTKLNATGTAILYSTYLGGSGSDFGAALRVDAAGNVYVAGWTSSPDFPTVSAYQATNRGGDAFVAKLDPSGSALAYSTYLGGTSSEMARALAIDDAGDAYVAGGTFSTDFPTLNPVQAASGGGGYDAFVTKLSPSGSSLVYSTYLGGASEDIAHAIAVDGTGSATVAGHTFSTDFPTASPFQGASGGQRDAFVARLSPSGSSLAYSTYLGGGGEDEAEGLAVDATGSAYLTGTTLSTNFPLVSPLRPSLSGMLDAFVAKLAPSGTALVYSTYLGGAGFEQGFGIAVDASGSAVVTGSTESDDFPLASPFQAVRRSLLSDAFVTRLAPSGTTLVFSTYLGGSDGSYGDSGRAVALDALGGILVTGETQSADFPTQAPIRPGRAAGFDAFVARFPPLLYGNGPLVNGREVTNGVPTAVSILQNASLGLSIFGFGNQALGGNRVADDFTVPAGGWSLDRITFYEYQTQVCDPQPGSPDDCTKPPVSTFTSLNYRIWDGLPGVGSVVFGDTATNRLLSSTYSGINRVAEAGNDGGRRAIMANVAAAGVSLPPGTYWLDWQADGTRASGPWQPPITVTGQAATGNGEQSTAGTAFTPVLDGGLLPQGFPFELSGVASPSLSCDDVAVSKPVSGTTVATFTLRLSGASPLPVTVDVTTTDGTAEAGTDYAALSGSVTIPAGATSTTVGVLVYGNRVFRGGRSFFLDLASPSNANLADARGEAVLSDPNPPGLSIDDVATSRGPAPKTARFTVTLSPAGASPVTVGYATADGTASAGVDYTAASGTLTFAPGTVSQPIDVTVSPAGAASGVQTFFVNLSGASGAAIAYAQGQATLSDPGFRTLTPCRLVDTRAAAGPFGGPALKAGVIRTFLVAGGCGVPVSARTVSLNVTVTAATALGNVRLYPAGTPVPLVSNVNFVAGQNRANNAVVSLGARGEIAVLFAQAAGSSAHLVLDLNGYFE